MTFPIVSRRGRHFANVGDVIIYWSDLVVDRTGECVVPGMQAFGWSLDNRCYFNLVFTTELKHFDVWICYVNLELF